jgi:hypothetical protein
MPERLAWLSERYDVSLWTVFAIAEDVLDVDPSAVVELYRKHNTVRIGSANDRVIAEENLVRIYRNSNDDGRELILEAANLAARLYKRDNTSVKIPTSPPRRHVKRR